MKKGVLLLLALFLLAPHKLGANAERIVSFAADVYVSKQNVAQIKETITYDFGTAQHHGILRFVPTEYTDERSQRYYLNFEFQSATDQQGRKLQTKVEESNGNAVVRVGDPDKTITGQHTYVLQYQLDPVVSRGDGRGFLNLDITGNGWTVPIDRASASLRFEGEASLDKATCYAGPVGSTTTCAVQESFPPTYVASNLSAGEGLTINGYVPDGYVSRYLQPGVKPPMSAAQIFAVIFWPALALGAAWILLLRWRRERGRKRRQTIIAQYEPPAGLSPGHIGLLQDDRSDMKEVTATIIDLAVRGYLKVEQLKPKRWWFKAKYALHKLKDSVGLSPNEMTIFNALFNAGDRVELNKLEKTAMAAAVSQYKSELKNHLTSKGYYGSFSKEPNWWEKLLDTGNITDVGSKEWAKVEGFKLYLGVAEKDRLNFTDAPEKTPELFSKLLPYAVALGVEKQWAKQFAGIDVAPTTNRWYSGSNIGHFNATALASDLGGSFASTVSANSTVSSSGGSSGGGVGGGGGGSW